MGGRWLCSRDCPMRDGSDDREGNYGENAGRAAHGRCRGWLLVGSPQACSVYVASTTVPPAAPFMMRSMACWASAFST